MKLNRFQKFCFLFSILWPMLVFTTSCSANWITEATNIIQLLTAAIPSLLALLSAFGVGLPAGTLTAVQAWSSDATKALATVRTMIDEYNAADASAKPGILSEIQNVLSVVQSNLSALLPEIKVTDPATQAKIQAVFGLVVSEFASLVALIPALQGKTTLHEAKKLAVAVKTPQEFKKEFNEAVSALDPQYQI